MVFIDEKEVDSRLENEGCLFDWEEHDEQVRAEVIEEFVKAMESIDKQSGGLGIDIIDVWDVKEYLKEKSNE